MIVRTVRTGRTVRTVRSVRTVRTVREVVLLYDHLTSLTTRSTVRITQSHVGIVGR